jgi:hypothetical protein
MPLTEFDPDKGPLFTGAFTKLDVIDPAIPGHVRNLVIDPRKPFNIEITWKIEGSDVPLYLTALDANWSVEAFAESVGPGPDLRIATGSVSKGTAPFSTTETYSVTLTVPANTLPEHDPGQNSPSGVYMLVVTVFLNSSIGAPGFDIAGFHEGPMIRVESPI